MRVDLTGFKPGAVPVAVAVALSALLPLAAQAGEVATDALPPEGCTHLITIEAASCLTTRLWTCPDDPEGHHWYGVQIAGVHTEVNRVDAQMNPVETHYIEDAAIVVQTDVTDPVNLSAMLKTAEDDFDYVRSGDDGRADERYVGQMAMMGRLVTIDGQEMHQVYLDYDVFRGPEMIWSGSAVQYLTPDRTMLLYGQDYDAEGRALTDYTPIRFVTPAEDAEARDCEG